MKGFIEGIIGFRSEGFRGEGYRDLIDVCVHEIECLGNEDIPDHLMDMGWVNDAGSVMTFLESLQKKGYSECVWLCRKEQDVDSCYGEEGASDSHDELDQYEIEKGIIISDLDEYGFLVAYNPEQIRVL